MVPPIILQLYQLLPIRITKRISLHTPMSINDNENFIGYVSSGFAVSVVAFMTRLLCNSYRHTSNSVYPSRQPKENGSLSSSGREDGQTNPFPIKLWTRVCPWTGCEGWCVCLVWLYADSLARSFSCVGPWLLVGDMTL